MSPSAIAARFLIITLLGFIAFITFLVTMTILGLMVVDPTGCRDCLRYPVGVWALGLLGVFFIASMVREWNDAPAPFKKWISENRPVVAVAIIVILVFFYIFTR
ncbi:MAG: hypothetical protein NW215_14230 [Hyphomicrobiales bacterium]|nr:hypothetical protein [Hyphomicrobiales bacterium]